MGIRSDLSFSAWLRGRRAQLDQKQGESCEIVGVSRQSWAYWESGKSEPTRVDHLRALAEWGGVEPGELLGILSAENETDAVAAD